MAEYDSIALLDELRKIKGCELIVFTTYSFDPVFFDNAVVRDVQNNNPRAPIIVLIDAKNFAAVIPSFTESTGKSYLLIPVTGAIFHPKMFVFCWENRGKVFIGSHNLTLTGLTHNLELSAVISDSGLVCSSLDYVIGIIERFVSSNNPFLTQMKKVRSGLVETKGGKELLIHNLSRPIIDTVLPEVVSRLGKVTTTTIVSPYFSKERELIGKIVKATGSTIEICVQKQNHNLDVDSLRSTTHIRFQEIIESEGRRVHCKLLLFRGKKNNVAVLGSPNFTNEALGSVAGSGNYEAAVLYEIPDDSILSHIKLKEISAEEVKASARSDIYPSTKIDSHFVHLSLAYRDELGILKVEYHTDADVKAQIEIAGDDRQRHAEEVYFQKKHLEPLSLALRDSSILGNNVKLQVMNDGKVISNTIRVYAPSVYPHIRLSSSEPGVLIKVLSGAGYWEHIYQIIANVFEERVPIDEHGGGKGNGGEQPDEPSLGKLSFKRRSRSFLELILELLRIPRTTINGGDSPSREKLGKRSTARMLSQEEMAEKIPNRLKEKYAKQFRVSADIQLYTLYVLINLKIFENLNLERSSSTYILKTLSGLSDIMASKVSGSRESLLEFLTLLLYLMSNSDNLAVRRIVKNDILPKIEPLLKQEFVLPEDYHSRIEQFENSLSDELKKFNLNGTGKEYDYLEEIMSYVILKNEWELKVSKARTLLNKIIDDMCADSSAILYERILKELLHKDAKIAAVIRSDASRILTERKLKGLKATIVKELVR